MTRLHHTVFGAVCFLILGSASPARAAPLHPRFLGDPQIRVPPERAVNPEVQNAAATRFGRRWTGHPRLCVLLVDFSDRPADALSHPPSYFDELFFSEGRVATGSLREWYREATYDSIRWDGRSFGWFRMPLTYAEYASNESGYCACYPNNALGLVDHAFLAARTGGVDFSAFDNDGPDGVPQSGDDDGILDGLAIVFAGFGAERTGQLTDLRSHYSSTPGELEADGIRVPDYVLIPESENVGVPVHEIGHLLGAVDLYDLSGRAAGLGYYSVMSYGMWFNNGRQPGGPDPYTRMLWGVLEPEALQVDERGLELAPIESSGQALRLWTRGEQGPEYFLLEHRTTVGLDRFLFGDGLLLYHVDETVAAQTNGSRYRVDLVQADGLRTLNGQGTVRNLGEFGDYFPGATANRSIDDDTVPSTLSNAGERTSVALRNIGDLESRIVFDAEVGRFLGTAPDPRLNVMPDGDPFAAAVRPGEPQTVRLLVTNRGTRLEAGTVRVFSRDPRVRLPEVTEFQAASLGGLQTLPLGEVTVLVNGPGEDEAAAVPLEMTWTLTDSTWKLGAALPLLGNVRLREGFEADAAHVTTHSVDGGTSPWSRVSGGFEGNRCWQTRNYDGNQEAVLEVGPIALHGYASELRFHQKIATPTSGAYVYDGGFLEASVDGGPWMLLEPEGGYPFLFGYAEGNPYPNHPSWGGTSPWHEVVVPLFLRGNVSFRFHFVSDFSGYLGLYDGWAVDAFLLRSWEHAHAVAFEPPRYEGTTGEIEFEVFPLFDREAPEEMRLVRDAGDSDLELGRWTLTGRRSHSLLVSGLKPGRVERLWIEWEGGDRQGPFLLGLPGAESARLLDLTPAIVRRGEGASITYRVPGNTALPIHLEVFDVRGARVARLEEGLRDPGSHVHTGFPERALRSPLGAGLYVLRLSGPGFSETRRVIVLMP